MSAPDPSSNGPFLTKEGQELIDQVMGAAAAHVLQYMNAGAEITIVARIPGVSGTQLVYSSDKVLAEYIKDHMLAIEIASMNIIN